jgi:hypothetical protein
VKRPSLSQADYAEKYAELIALVTAGVEVSKACHSVGIDYNRAVYVLHRAGYRRKWVKIEDDGSETQFDAW